MQASHVPPRVQDCIKGVTFAFMAMLSGVFPATSMCPPKVRMKVRSLQHFSKFDPPIRSSGSFFRQQHGLCRRTKFYATHMAAGFVPCSAGATQTAPCLPLPPLSLYFPALRLRLRHSDPSCQEITTRKRKSMPEASMLRSSNTPTRTTCSSSC